MSANRQARRSNRDTHPPLTDIGRCLESGKQQYASRSQAKRAMKIINKRRESAGVDHRERGAYECPSCGYWHLTSQESR